jgi:phosphatidylglycerophosphatase A
MGKKLDWNLLRSVFRDPILFLATGGGIGCSPAGPGTLGALLGLISAYGMHTYLSPMSYLIVCIALVVVGIPICGQSARKLQLEDPTCVVWDEIVTVPLVFLGTRGALGENAWYWIVGFALHRIFDISKIFPGRKSEELPGGWGIMTDDCVAAGYACLGMHLLQWSSIGGRL